MSERTAVGIVSAMGAPRAQAARVEFETAWDRAVDVTPGADEFCASSVWSFSAAESFPTAGEPRFVTDGVGFCGMRETTTEDGVEVLVGLDPVWGFATPCVGPASAAARAQAELMERFARPLTIIGGQDETSPLAASIAARLERSHRLLKGPEEIRLRADLTGGFDAWFARRSSRFRQRLRVLQRRADERGVEISEVSAQDPDTVIDRMLSIETLSWKGQAGTGLASSDLADFYRSMAWRLAARDALRAHVAVADGRDVGFILGGVRGSTYRGLQLSYVSAEASLGIGHLLQMRQLRSAASEGLATYDLGMDMEYKRRWADDEHSTFSMIAVADG